MSTLAAPHTGFRQTRPALTETKPAVASAYRLLVTYALLIPLVFFAARGSFSIQSMGYNHPQSAAYGLSPDAGQGSVLHSAELILAYGITAVLAVANFEAVANACLNNLLLLALPAWAICSTLWSNDPTRTIAFSVLAMVMTVFGLYLGTRFTPRQQMQLFLLTGLLTTAASVLLIAVLPAAGVDYKNSTVGLQGIYPSKNICAAVTAGFLTTAFLYKFKGKGGPMKRLAYVVLLIALIIGSTARTGWIVTLLVVGFIALMRFMRSVRPIERITLAWFLPALTAVGTWFVYSNQAEIAVALGKDPTFSGRTNIWSVMFLAIVERPFLGFGYDAFFIVGSGELHRLSLAAGDASLSNAENGILQMWLEIGLVGLVILAFILIRSCKHAIQCFRSDTPDYAIWYMSILFITLLALVDGDKFMYPNAIEWVMFIMADVGLAREAKRVRTSRSAWA